MKGSLAKGIFIVLLALGSLGICFMGYRVNSNRIHKQKVTYAESTIKASETALEEISNSMIALYADEHKQLLIDEVSEDNINQMISKTSAIQTSAESFNLSEKNLPNSLENLGKEKEAVLQELRGIKTKVLLQNNIDELFENGISNWQSAHDDVTIKADLTNEEIAAVQNEVNQQQEGAWRDLANKYIGFAEEQLKHVAEIQSLIDTYMKDGALVGEVSHADYEPIEDGIEEVKNATLKHDLEQQADALLALIDEASPRTSGNTANTTPIDDDYNYGYGW